MAENQPSAREQRVDLIARKLVNTARAQAPPIVPLAPEIEVLLAMFFQGSIALGEHCFWRGHTLSQATWYDLCANWEERLQDDVTTDRDAHPYPPLDLIEIRPNQPAIFYQNRESDGRIGLTDFGRLVVRRLITLLLALADASKVPPCLNGQALNQAGLSSSQM